MAYKKYIKRGGKTYGPYIYHSRRVDGKVVSEYRGSGKPDYKKFVFIGMGVLLLITFIYVISVSEKSITGQAVLNLNANYQEGQPLEGTLKLTLQEGEFIPVSSNIIFENNGNILEYNLVDLLSEELITTDFGDGYGIPGEKQIFPSVGFVLIVESGVIEGNETISILNEVQGQVSAEESFIYNLEEGETKAELKLLSVNIGGEKLSDSIVNVETLGNEVIVTTDYFEFEEGFGENYTGTDSKDLTIEFSQLGLVLTPGNLRVSVVNEGEELVFMTTIIGEGGATTAPETVDVATETAVVIPDATELTEIERAILEAEFGTPLSVKVNEAKSKNGFTIIKYELGEYWVENSYSEELSEVKLREFMEKDRIKWLKDIANKFLEQAEPEQILEEFTGNYSV